MNEIQSFNFEGVANIQAIDKNGMSWFVAGDICKALGFKQTNDATKYLDPDEKGTMINRTLGGDQQVTIINESGLYSLIFKSRKEEAIRFKKWITSEVLPSIRKNGGYINGQEALSTESQAIAAQEIADHAQWVRERHAEEKDARYNALRFLNAGRTRRKRPKLHP